MKKNFNILCPVDFSAASKNALDYAARMASVIGGRINIINIYKPPLISTDQPMDVFDVEIAQSQIVIKFKLEGLIEYVHKIDKNIDCSSQLLLGDTEEEIININKDETFDIVIIGFRNSKKIERALFGSTSIKMIKNLICPLIIIPEEYTYVNIEKVVYATDCHDSDIQSIHWIIYLLSAYQPQIVMLNVGLSTPSGTIEYNDFCTVIKENVTYENLQFQKQYVGDVRNGIELFDIVNDTNLLVMMTRKRKGIEKWFNNSMTEKIAKKILCPLLVLHIPELDDRNSKNLIMSLDSIMIH